MKEISLNSKEGILLFQQKLSEAKEKSDEKLNKQMKVYRINEDLDADVYELVRNTHRSENAHIAKINLFIQKNPQQAQTAIQDKWKHIERNRADRENYVNISYLRKQHRMNIKQNKINSNMEKLTKYVFYLTIFTAILTIIQIIV